MTDNIQDRLRQALDGLPDTPWEVWTSCSFRRITGPDGGDGGVLSGITQRSDGHPDLSMNEEQLERLCAIVNGAGEAANVIDGLVEVLGRIAKQMTSKELTIE